MPLDTQQRSAFARASASSPDRACQARRAAWGGAPHGARVVVVGEHELDGRVALVGLQVRARGRDRPGQVARKAMLLHLAGPKLRARARSRQAAPRSNCAARAGGRGEAARLGEAVRDAAADGLGAVELGSRPDVQHLVAARLRPGRDHATEQVQLRARARPQASPGGAAARAAARARAGAGATRLGLGAAGMLQHDLGQAAVALCHLHVVLDVCARRRGPQRRAWAGRRAGGGADAVSGAALCFDASSASSVATAAARSRLLRLRLPPAQAGRAAHARPRAGHGASLPRQPHKIFVRWTEALGWHTLLPARQLSLPWWRAALAAAAARTACPGRGDAAVRRTGRARPGRLQKQGSRGRAFSRRAPGRHAARASAAPGAAPRAAQAQRSLIPASACLQAQICSRQASKASGAAAAKPYELPPSLELARRRDPAERFPGVHGV